MYLLIVGSHYCVMRFAYALHMRQHNVFPFPCLYIEFLELVIEVIFHYCITELRNQKYRQKTPEMLSLKRY